MLKKKSIRVKFLLLILIITIPVIGIQINNLIDHYNNKVNSELSELSCFAGLISSFFMDYVEDIWKNEEAIADYIKFNSNLSVSEINAVLKYSKQQQEGILDIFYLDSNGKVLASSVEDSQYKNILKYSYVTAFNRGQDKLIGNLTANIQNYNYVIPVLCRIRNDIKLSGIIIALIDVDKLVYSIPDISHYRNYLLIDSNGMIVYSSEFRNNIKNKGCLINDFGVEQALKGRVVTTAKEKNVIDGSLQISVDYPISDSGWALKIYSPYGLVLSSHLVEISKNIIVLVITFALTIIIHMLWMNKFLKSTFAVKSAAMKIMAGDNSARTNVKSEDDIGLTAMAFDKMAESVERWTLEKTQLFTNISHELKTPINVIYASVQLIDSYKISCELTLETYQKKVTRQMKIIHQNCYRIMRLISNLMDISRHDSGFLKAKLDNLDIVKLIREITLSVERYVEGKGIRLLFKSDLESRIMACDPDMVERILLNLISNAVKFTEKDGIITVNLKEEQKQIILSVEDTGTGIPQDMLNIIFERFRQADAPFHRNLDGSGIGLSLVKAFVDAQGGTITVTSEESKGTIFSINLPICLLDGSPNNKRDPIKNSPLISPPNAISRTNIEFSDIYSLYDEEITQKKSGNGEAS